MEIKELEEKIKESSQKYYSDGTSDLSDQEFDILIEELRIKDPNNPLLGNDEVEKNSNKNKNEHLYSHIVSLSKVKFDNINPDDYDLSKYNVSLKLDGLSCVTYWENGKFVKALTLGDGKVGIDITEKLRNINFLNNNIKEIEGFTGSIRGELIIPRKVSNTLNIGSPKNYVMDIINRNEVNDEIKYIDYVVYSVVGTNIDFKTYDEIIKFLRKNFRDVVETFEVRDIEELSGIYDRMSTIYDIDGLVMTEKELNYF